MGKEIEKFIAGKLGKIADSRPIIFNLREKGDEARLKELIAKNKIQYVSDDYDEQLKEYFQVKNPGLVYAPNFWEKFSDYVDGLGVETPLFRRGRWIYFPWKLTLVHILEEDAFFAVRTARNKNLINPDEQNKFYNAVIGIAGQSVGNSVTLAIVLQGGGKYWKIADHDRLALSNTNRIRTGIDNLGILKTEMTARQIYEINPYAKVELFSEGITKDNIDSFFEGPPKLDIVIDEIDNLAVKYLIREKAKKHKLAVVMAADNGDNGVLDIERYDEDPNLEFFHGRIGNVTYETLTALDKFGIGKTITMHIGPENVTQRMQASLLEMGKTIVSWPQLGGAALLNGSAVAYAVRKILNGEPLEGNRAIISLDEKLVPDYNAEVNIQKRNKISDDFKKIFGL